MKTETIAAQWFPAFVSLAQSWAAKVVLEPRFGMSARIQVSC